MNANETVKAQHELESGETKEFTLVATPLKKVKKGEAVRHYPWFAEKEATFDNLASIFGEEMLKELAVEALNRQFQTLYFQRSPSGELVPVMKDGKPATLPDGKPVLQPDESPRLPQFLTFIKDPNLSGREITVEYCMRKVIAVQIGKDKAVEVSIKDLPDQMKQIKRMQAAMVWIQKSQELASVVLAEEKD